MITKAVAIVTGARSGIGKAITLRLLAMEYRVIGISRTITANDINHTNFSPLQCDLSKSDEIAKKCERVTKNSEIKLLINAAGFGRFEPHEELNVLTIQRMTALNLTAPMILTNLLLRSLKKNEGTIINITSIEAVRSSKFSALYSATKAGLRAFGLSLFEELRKSGVNIVTLNPDMTDTDFFNALRFGVSDKEGTYLLSEDLADAVEQILTMRIGVSVTEMTIRPQHFGIRKK